MTSVSMPTGERMQGVSTAAWAGRNGVRCRHAGCLPWLAARWWRWKA